MNLVDLVSDMPNTVIDRRADKYDNHKPGFVSTYLCKTLNRAWMMLDKSDIRPVAIVKEDGSILITSAGGSGHIWVIGESVNGKQHVIVDRLREILISLGGAAVYSDSLPFV